MSVRSIRQVGSVLSFIVVAFFLVVATVGSIYFVNQRGEQARKDEASKLADQLIQQESKDNSTDSSPDSSTSSEVVPSTPLPVSVSAQQDSDLPTTGIGLDTVRMLIIGLLVVSAVSYKTSRANLRRLL
jgi:cytoskeletal protein RodZ